MINCEELQLDLPLYSDGILDAEQRERLDVHLQCCPLCREKADQLGRLRVELRAFARPEMPENVLSSIRAAVRLQLQPEVRAPGFNLLEPRRKWADVWLMPYTVGGFATVLLSLALLSAMLSASIRPLVVEDRGSRSSAILLASAPSVQPFPLDPAEYALSRNAVAQDSPSVNPNGPLVELTRTMGYGDVDNDEVVVVADVFENGSAKITEVVEPSSDVQAVAKLQKALETDPGYAPFVPASFDRRSELVRVVLKIQNVEVYTQLQ